MKQFGKNVILAIETSCDDTCLALLKIKKTGRIEILKNLISSQVKLHQKYGGVYPLLAKREHQKNLPFLFKKATKGINKERIKVISVTVGPGLEPCLWVGVNFAKDLAKKLNIPIIPVNHIEAHIFAGLFRKKPGPQVFSEIFPAIALIVSGGHTQLILIKDFGKYKILGETRDDAAGECFDKTARILGMGYPGGPLIEAEASKLKIKNSKLKIKLPRPMISQRNYDFSFSGLKTAVLYDYKKQKPKAKKDKKYIRMMAKEIQQSIIDVLIKKTLKAARDFRAKAVILGGGVTANKELRKQFKERFKKDLPDIKYCLPDAKYSTDNALMIAITAFNHISPKNLKKPDKIKANANLSIEDKIL